MAKTKLENDLIVIDDRCYQLNQSWYMELTVRVYDYVFRIRLRRNAYDFQSYVIGELLDNGWQKIIERPITPECHSYTINYTDSAPDMSLMKKDIGQVLTELRTLFEVW